MSELSEVFTPTVVSDLRAIKAHFGEERPTDTFICQTLLAARDFIRQAPKLKAFQDMSVQDLISLVEDA